MRRFALLLISGVVGSINVGLQADEIAGTVEARTEEAKRVALIETTLSAWLNEARECRSYDAKFTRWIYEREFGKPEQPTVEEGRLLFQRTGPSRYEVPTSGDFLWRADEYGLIDRKKKTYSYFAGRDLKAIRKIRREPPPKDLGFWAALGHGLVLIHYLEEADVMPHLLATDHTHLRADYDFYLTDWSPNRIVLTADLKHGWYSGRVVFRSIDFAFSDGRPLPYAVRFDEGFGRKTVYQFRDARTNQTAADAEAFLNPDLSGLERIDLGDRYREPGKAVKSAPPLSHGPDDELP